MLAKKTLQRDNEALPTRLLGADRAVEVSGGGLACKELFHRGDVTEQFFIRGPRRCEANRVLVVTAG